MKKENKSPKLKILTFNHHEAYLSNLAKTGHVFYVVTAIGPRKLEWDPSQPPMPSNMRPVCFDQSIRTKLNQNYFDLVIVHTLTSLLSLWRYPNINIIFIQHIHLFRASNFEIGKSLFKKLFLRLFCLFYQVDLVAVSQAKQKSWGFKCAQVITNAPSFKQAEVLAARDKTIVVSNNAEQRAAEAGFAAIKYVAENIPLCLLGRGNRLKGSSIPRDYMHFQKLFAQGRVYFFAIQAPYDEFNMALLEAMYQKMAIVAMYHPNSPIIHEHNGLIAHTFDEAILHIQNLHLDDARCQFLGENAYQTVKRFYSIDTFIQKWNRILKP